MQITARLAVEAGADAIHLSAYRDMTSGQAFTDGMILDQEAKHSALSGRLTEALPVPVIAVGQIRPSIGDQMIGHGKTTSLRWGGRCSPTPKQDARSREPGRGDSALHQLLRLRRPAFFDRRVKCAVNPVLARESELGAVESTPAETPKKIVVVGGGPAGLEVARVATLRGHDVTVFEAARNIGERCVSRRCSTNPTFGCSGGTSTRCGAWRSTSASPRPQPPRRLLRSP